MSVIPETIGMSREDAIATLAAAGYSLRGEVHQFSDQYPAGISMGTDPPGNLELGRDVPVITLFISEGELPPTVPDVLGLSQQEGFRRLLNAGYQVTSSFETSSEEAGGTVVSQDPLGGSYAFPPGPVHIGVGSPPVVFVPTDPPTKISEFPETMIE
jgi:beta-lactam-binding protein with PASTA domain